MNIPRIIPHTENIDSIDVAVEALRKKNFPLVLKIFNKLADEPENKLLDYLKTWAVTSHSKKKTIAKTLHIFAGYLADQSKLHLSKEIVEFIENRKSPLIHLHKMRTQSAPSWLNRPRSDSAPLLNEQDIDIQELFRQCLDFQMKHQFIELFNQFTILSHLQFPENFREVWMEIKKKCPQAGECLNSYRLFLTSRNKIQKLLEIQNLLVPPPTQSIAIKKTRSLILAPKKNSSPDKDIHELLRQVSEQLKQTKELLSITQNSFEEIAKARNFNEIFEWICQDHTQAISEKIQVLEEFAFFLFRDDKAAQAFKILKYLKEVRKTHKELSGEDHFKDWKNLQTKCRKKELHSFMAYFFLSFPSSIRGEILKKFSYRKDNKQKIWLAQFFNTHSGSFHLLELLSFFYHPKSHKLESNFIMRLAKKINTIFRHDFDSSFKLMKLHIGCLKKQGIYDFEQKEFIKKSSLLFSILNQSICKAEHELNQLWTYFINKNLLTNCSECGQKSLETPVEASSPNKPSSIQSIFQLDALE